MLIPSSRRLFRSTVFALSLALFPRTPASADLQVEARWMPGNIGVTRVLSSVDTPLCAGPCPIDVGAENEYVRITGTRKIPGTLHTFDFPVEVTLPVPFLRNIYSRTDITPSFAGEGWHRLRGSEFFWDAMTLVVYDMGGGLGVGAGVEVYGFTHSVSPVAGFILKKGKTMVSLVDRLRISRTVDRSTDVFIESSAFLFGSTEYRVRGSDGRPDILEYREEYTGVGIARTRGAWNFSLGAGAVYHRHFRLRASPLELKLSPGPYLSATATLNF